MKVSKYLKAPGLTVVDTEIVAPKPKKDEKKKKKEDDADEDLSIDDFVPMG